MRITNDYHSGYWIFILFLMVAACPNQLEITQQDTRQAVIRTKSNNTSGTTTAHPDSLKYPNAPNNITRNIIQDARGDLWFATFGGMIKYDGQIFTPIPTGNAGDRFFSVLEDRHGTLWFGSIGAGVYRYDGTNLENFTTENGLINNEIVCIYEDKVGHLWFGANGGLSRFDGQHFKNYILQNNNIVEDTKGTIVPNMQRPPHEINAIIEDDGGNLWIATRGSTYVYDGNTFELLEHQNPSFSNVRCMIIDQKSRIWLGGNSGLWYYDSNDFTQVSDEFIGYIYEDTKGDIWTSSTCGSRWALSKYSDLSNPKNPEVDIIKADEGMFFGIFEDNKGHIWSGTLQGVYRYDGYKLESFNR